MELIIVFPAIVQKTKVAERKLKALPLAIACLAFWRSWMHLSTSEMLFERLDFLRSLSYSFSMDSIL